MATGTAYHDVAVRDVICAVGRRVFALWSGQKEQLEQLQTEEQKLKDEYKGKLQQAINLEELRKQREQVSQYVLTLEKQLPSKSEMDALLSDINQAGVGAARAGLRIVPAGADECARVLRRTADRSQSIGQVSRSRSVCE